GLFPLKIRWPISIVNTKPAETKRYQEHAYDDPTPKYPTAACRGSKVRLQREIRGLSHARTFIGLVARNVNSPARLRKWRQLSIPLASLDAGARSNLRRACLPSLRDRLLDVRHTESRGHIARRRIPAADPEHDHLRRR